MRCTTPIFMILIASTPVFTWAGGQNLQKCTDERTALPCQERPNLPKAQKPKLARPKPVRPQVDPNVFVAQVPKAPRPPHKPKPAKKPE